MSRSSSSRSNNGGNNNCKFRRRFSSSNNNINKNIRHNSHHRKFTSKYSFSSISNYSNKYKYTICSSCNSHHHHHHYHRHHISPLLYSNFRAASEKKATSCSPSLILFRLPFSSSTFIALTLRRRTRRSPRRWST